MICILMKVLFFINIHVDLSLNVSTHIPSNLASLAYSILLVRLALLPYNWALRVTQTRESFNNNSSSSNNTNYCETFERNNVRFILKLNLIPYSKFNLSLPFSDLGYEIHSNDYKLIQNWFSRS